MSPSLAAGRAARSLAKLATLAAVVVAACRAPAVTEVPAQSTGGPMLPVRSLGTPAFDSAVAAFRYNSGVDRHARLVVRSQAEWATLWAEITRNVSPVPPVPAVDFAERMVLVAAMGTRSSGGHAIAVETVESAGGVLRASVVERSPGARCVTTGALTQPLAAVVVPRTAGEVAWAERTAVVDCAP